MRKNINKYIIALGVAAFSTTACNDFESINKDPNAVPQENVKIEYLLTQSMYQAQQDPNIAERIFILTWDRAARFERGNLYTVNNGYLSEYWAMGYMTGWIRSASLAIKIGNDRIQSGVNTASTNNIVQMARIWRAYLWIEQSDMWGPIPVIGAYEGVNPSYNDVKTVYYESLKELSQAVDAIEVNTKLTNDEAKGDLFFTGDVLKWQKYANSLRMRLAMRIKNVDPTKSQSEFEAAAKHPAGYISNASEIASAAEGGGWDATTGVMTRAWNWQPISLAFSNLTLGIGGVTLSDMVGVKGTSAYGLPSDVINQYAKSPARYIGREMPNHLPTSTNVNNAGYLFDAIPNEIDPRTLVNFSIPGYDDGTVSPFNSTTPLASTVKLPISSTDVTTIEYRTKYTWGAFANGAWADKGTLFAAFTNAVQNIPSKSAKLRDNQNRRVFFGAWESYFLLAEAAHYGWSVGITTKSAYEAGVRASFEFQGVGSLADKYLTSEAYNRIGTSAKFDHTAEVSSVMLDGTNFDGSIKSVNYIFPQGYYATNNDILTKIITQKYIAQMPWLPNEAWNDYRRLALPFLENPVLEIPIPTMPWYTDPKALNLKNNVQRGQYPASQQTTNEAGYNSGVSALGVGGDKCDTFLWWAKKE